MIKNARIIRKVDFMEIVHIELPYKRRESVVPKISR